MAPDGARSWESGLASRDACRHVHSDDARAGASAQAAKRAHVRAVIWSAYFGHVAARSGGRGHEALQRLGMHAREGEGMPKPRVGSPGSSGAQLESDASAKSGLEYGKLHAPTEGARGGSADHLEQAALSPGATGRCTPTLVQLIAAGIDHSRSTALHIRTAQIT